MMMRIGCGELKLFQKTEDLEDVDVTRGGMAPTDTLPSGDLENNAVDIEPNLEHSDSLEFLLDYLTGRADLVTEADRMKTDSECRYYSLELFLRFSFI
jgi:hypothetical protein